MDDVRLASALQRGADGALSRVYACYAPRLYDYCLTFFADSDAAADALHEAMLVAASWAPFLADRSQLRLWLYAITRNECLRKLRRNTAPSLGVGAPPRPATPSHGRTDPVLREVTDLVFRHSFDPAGVATVLNLSPRRARALCARSAAVLGRDRRGSARISTQARPSLPQNLRDRVLASATMRSRVAYRGEVAMPRQRNGFPVPLPHAGAPRVRNRTVVKVAAGVAALGFVAAGVAGAALARPHVLGLVEAGSPQHPSGGRSGGAPSTPPAWHPGPLPSESGSDPVVVVKRGRITGLGGKCLDVRSGSSADGAPVNLAACDSGNGGQQWTIGADGSVRALGRCLTAPQPGTDATVQLRPCTSEPPQQWNPQIDGTLISVSTNRCLELPGSETDTFTLLDMASCSGAANQQWKLPG
jgi:DNA-directed RNA polymerase specialized sigma24 family protein